MAVFIWFAFVCRCIVLYCLVCLVVVRFVCICCLACMGLHAFFLNLSGRCLFRCCWVCLAWLSVYRACLCLLLLGFFWLR